MCNRFEKVSFEEFKKALKDTEFGNLNSDIQKRLYDEIKLPKRATTGSAGYDFFSPLPICLEVGETEKIPTGIKCKLRPDRVLMIFPRSSLGFKYRLQLDNTVGVVDSDYYNNESNEGHIFIKITNDGTQGKTVEILPQDAFAQGIIMPYDTTIDDEVSIVRTGGIGSTSRQ